jgi:hypothetical protein
MPIDVVTGGLKASGCPMPFLPDALLDLTLSLQLHCDQPARHRPC